MKSQDDLTEASSPEDRIELAQGISSHSTASPRWLVALFIVLSIVQVYRLTKPSTEGNFRLGFLGENGARYSLAGRNYARHGFLATRFAPDFSPGVPREGERMLYLHHPPMAPWLVGLSFQHYEESERGASLPFVLLGLLTPLLLFAVGRRAMTSGGAAFAALFFASVPMTGLYGAHIDPQGPVCTIGILLATLAFLRDRERGGVGRRVAFAMALLFALLTDWPAVLFAFLVPVATWRFPSRRPVPFWFAPSVAIAFLILFIGWIYAVGETPETALLSSAGVRSWGVLFAAGDGMRERWLGWGVHLVELFTLPLLAIALLGLVPAIRRPVVERTGGFGVTMVLLVGTGLLHVLLFPAGALVHDYWTYLLLPPLALLAGGAAEGMRASIARAWGVGFSLVVALGLVAGVAWVGDQTTARLYQIEEDKAAALPHPIFGRLVRESVRPGQKVVTNLPYNPQRSSILFYPTFTWYADRRVRGGVDTVEKLARAQAEEGPFDRFVYIPLGGTPEIAAHLFKLDPNHSDRESVVPASVGVDRVRVFVFDLTNR